MKPLILVGLRGSGKSTVGRAVATAASCPFVDLDATLVEQTKQSIAEIFSTSGEPAFRQIEAEVLVKVLEQNRTQVIATGGGVVLAETNRRIMKSSGFVVWLQAPAELLWQRIQADPATALNRPALTAHTGLAEVQALLAARIPLYADVAHFTVDATESPEALAKRILKAWNAFTPSATAEA